MCGVSWQVRKICRTSMDRIVSRDRLRLACPGPLGRARSVHDYGCCREANVNPGVRSAAHILLAVLGIATAAFGVGFMLAPAPVWQLYGVSRCPCWCAGASLTRFC